MQMTSHRNLCWVSVVAMTAVCSLTPPALAQLGISPTIVEAQVHPGGVRTFQVNVSNTGGKPLECTVGVMAMTVEAGGLPVAVAEAPRSCKDWITVKPEKFVLRPKEGKRLVCNVRAPKDVGGGYYAILSCSGAPQETADEARAEGGLGAGIKFTHRALVPVLLTVPAPRVQAILDAAMPILKRGEGHRGYAFALPIRNRGNIHCRMAGTIEIRSDAGQLIEKFELTAGRGFILPMHERLFRSRLRLNLPDAAYVANVRLDTTVGPPVRKAFPFCIENGQPKLVDLTEEAKAELMKRSPGFTVAPAQMLASLPAGGNRMQAVELVNLTDRTIPIRVRLFEWYRDPEGLDRVSADKPPHGRSGLAWVTLRTEKLELRPLSRQRVPVTVSLPKDADGERYAAVSFDRTDVELDDSATERTRRSARLRIWAEGTGEQGAEIVELRAARQPNGVIELAAEFKNTGTLSIAPEVQFSIWDDQGNIVGKGTPSSSVTAVQAGAEGVALAQWPRVLDPGKYSALLTLRFSQQQPPVTARTGFTVAQQPPAKPATGPAASRPSTQPPAEKAEP